MKMIADFTKQQFIKPHSSGLKKNNVMLNRYVTTT